MPLNARPIRRIVAVVPLTEFVVRVEFDDHTWKAIDLDPYLRGPVFQPLREHPDLFRAVTVDPELGSLHWPNGADLDTQVLYYDDLLPADWIEEGLSPQAARARKRGTVLAAGGEVPATRATGRYR